SSIPRPAGLWLPCGVHSPGFRSPQQPPSTPLLRESRGHRSPAWRPGFVFRPPSVPGRLPDANCSLSRPKNITESVGLLAMQGQDFGAGAGGLANRRGPNAFTPRGITEPPDAPGGATDDNSAPAGSERAVHATEDARTTAYRSLPAPEGEQIR